MAEQGSNDEVREPDNSTVDDWFGQNVARDQEVADKVASEAGSEDEAEDRFKEQADGEQRFKEGHPRPDDADESGDAVGHKP